MHCAGPFSQTAAQMMDACISAKADYLDITGEIVPQLPSEAVMARGRAIYLSHRDCAELIRCCLDNEMVRYGVYYGISNNPRQFWDLSHAKELLGWEPKDSAPA